MHTSVDGKKDFFHKKIVQCNLVLEALLVLADRVVEIAEAFGEDAVVAKKYPRCLLKQLDLSFEAIDIGGYMD